MISFLDLSKINNRFCEATEARFKKILDIGKLDESIYLEDWYMYLQLTKIGKYKYIPEILFSYRWHGNNRVSNPEFKAGTLEIYRQIYEHEKAYCFARGYKNQWRRQW